MVRGAIKIRAGRGYAVYLAGLGVWIGMIVLAPVLASSEHLAGLSNPIYFVFSGICHQRSERCLYVLGEPMAACARCTFLYLGILLSSLIHPLIGSPRVPKLRYLILAASPLIVDGGTQLIGLRESSNLVRAITGLAFGFAMAFYLAPEAEATVSLVVDRIRRRKGSDRQEVLTT